MTNINEFNQKNCKIDALDVNAYTDAYLKFNDPTKLIVESSWDKSEVDLTPTVKAAETQTTLKLDPETDPEYLRYDGEDGEPQCISGDELARIIKLMKLKDVDQDYTPTDGDILIYDGTTNLFKTFNLPDALGNLSDLIGDIQTQIANINTTLNNYGGRLTTIETTLTKPSGIPDDAVVAWGNINTYGDNTNANLKTSGIYTHNPSSDVTNDLFFA